MDIRVEKTEKAIRNAFLELRAAKPLEKITVKELCSLACINKSTFYSHYEDIYALSQMLESETITACLLYTSYGIGCFDKKAYEFVDALKAAGQSYWQILPLGPTSYGDSPYQSFSTFAGNPYFISLEAVSYTHLDVYKRQRHINTQARKP